MQFTVQDGWTPLHEAAEAGDVEALQQLVGAHANANAQTVKVGVSDMPHLVGDVIGWCHHWLTMSLIDIMS